jgi:hypothetical protein
MNNIMQSDPHLYAAHVGALAGCELLSLLPETDLTDELKNIYMVQLDLLNFVEMELEYEEESLISYVEYAMEVLSQVSRIKSYNKGKK